MMMNDVGMRVFVNIILRIGKWTLIFFGIIALVMITLAFTSAPFWIQYNLGISKSGITGVPDYIVVLGGGGIPSGTGLMRTYYGAKAGNQFPDALIIVALPGDREDSLSSVNQMRSELIGRGVAPERILLEDSGMNTRAEALLIKKMIQEKRYGMRDKRYVISDSNNRSDLSQIPDPGSRILLVTSPEHLYRSVLVFEKVGFRYVDGLPAFEKDLESGLSFSAKKLGGRKWVPDVGESLSLRYRFWSYLIYEVIILREWTAIGYYWLIGWI